MTNIALESEGYQSDLELYRSAWSMLQEDPLNSDLEKLVEGLEENLKKAEHSLHLAHYHHEWEKHERRSG